jgi:hypothetical protein
MIEECEIDSSKGPKISSSRKHLECGFRDNQPPTD